MKEKEYKTKEELIDFLNEKGILILIKIEQLILLKDIPFIILLIHIKDLLKIRKVCIGKAFHLKIFLIFIVLIKI